MTRDEALTLLPTYTQSDSLRKHTFAVIAALQGIADRLGFGAAGAAAAGTAPL